MISTLAQIITTFLAIMATFLAAYGIYLASTQANIDAEIQQGGAEIVNELQRAPVDKIPLAYFDIFLLNHYRTKYPNLGGIDLFEKATTDLILSTDPSAMEIAEKGNIPGRVRGRVAFWVLMRALDYLAPGKVYWPGRHGLITSSTSYTEQEFLFPFGPIGVKNWLEDFAKVQHIFKVILSTVYRYFILEDYRQFLKELDSPWKEAKDLHEFDYSKWLSEMEFTLDSIGKHYNRILILTRLKESYSIKNRIPHLSWILILSSFSFLLGILLPLGILGLGVESKVPQTVNLILLIVNMTLILGISIQLGLDIRVSSYKKFPIYRYYISLRDQLVNDQKKGPEELTINHDLVSQLLIDQKEIGLSQQSVQILEEYKNAVHQYNISSERLAGLLAEEIQSSGILAKHKVESETEVQATTGILVLLEQNARKDFIDHNLNPGKTILIQVQHGHVTENLIKLKSPEDKKQLEAFANEINRIYKAYEDHQNYKDYELARKNLRESQQRLLDWTNQQISAE